MESLKSICVKHDQTHILEVITNEEHPIYRQMLKIDVPKTIGFFEKAISCQTVDFGRIDPVASSKVSVLQDLDSQLKESYLHVGEDAIRTSKVAAVIMSGGQGTRLGYAGPKGMYSVCLPSDKTIFQIHIEKILKLRSLLHKSCTAPLRIPIYVMTSELNDAVIREYFRSMGYFGYPEEDIVFFEQGLLPCFAFDGKIIIESKDSLSLAPDGNGGIYFALQSSGAFDDMTNRGVEYLHVYGIDNILTKSLDPTFLGYCISNNLQCGNKVTWRQSKGEKVGVTASVCGRMHILEYSEIPSSLADAVDTNNRLVFGAANICNHFMTISFLRDIVFPSLSGSYHVARKKIPYLDPVAGSTVTPSSENGVKLEMFIFDVFPLAERWGVFEVPREDEFAPVKNAPGNPTDSPDTAVAMLSAQSKRWLQNAGAVIIESEGQGLGCKSSAACEISSLLSYDGEGLDSFSGKTVTLPCYLTK